MSAPSTVPYELNITWLYPDILNLHGERGNVMAVVRLCDQLGVTPQLTRVNRLADDITLDQTDVVVACPGELVVMPAVMKALSRYADGLKQFVDDGGTMLVTGTSGALLAHETRRTDNSGFNGLGLLDMTVRERDTIYGDDLLLRVDDQELSGIQVRLTDVQLGAGQAGFGQVRYGIGNSGRDDHQEGAKTNNLIFTNLLGPALVKNPWFAYRLVTTALTRRYPGTQWPELDDQWKLERQADQATRTFIANKQVPDSIYRSARLS